MMSSSTISATSNAVAASSCAKKPLKSIKTAAATAAVDCHPNPAHHPIGTLLLKRAAAPPVSCSSNKHQQLQQEQPQVYNYQPSSAISNECQQQIQRKAGTPVHDLPLHQQPSFVRSANRVPTPAAPPKKPMASTVAAVATTAPSTAPSCYVASTRPSSSSSSGNSTASSPPSTSIISSSSAGSRRSRAAEEFSPGDHFAKQSMRSSRLAGKGNTWLRFRRENQAINDLMLEDQTGIAFEIIERRCGPPVAETTAQKPTALHLR